MKIDFIAYHDLQSQAGASIFEELSKYFECKWRIGPNQMPSGAVAAIMLDHTGFHPGIKKSANGYKYLFHLSHDLGDIEIYKAERDNLKNYDIIFAPSVLHHNYAKEQFGRKTIVLQTGWAKYDKMEFTDKYKELRQKLKGLPYGFTIMYAPTGAWTYEWKYLLPLLKSLRCNVIVKNHIGVNKGQSFPTGQESEYRAHLKSAEEMERFAIEGSPENVIVAPRDLNICCLFAYVNTLISDQSSVLLEFAPFGITIETGRCDPNENNIVPQISLISKEVIFFDKIKICEVFGSIDKLNNFLAHFKPKPWPNVTDVSVGKLTSYLIRKYIDELRNQHVKSRVNFIHSLFSLFEKKNLQARMLMWRDLFLSGQFNVHPQYLAKDK